MATVLTKGEIVLFALRKFAIASNASLAGAGLASLLGTSTPWGAGIGAGIGLLGSLF